MNKTSFFRREYGYGLLAVAWCAIGAFLIWSLVAAPGCGKDRWNILVISMDTTRADRIRCYGYDWVETPGLNSLARDGILFERAYSHIPLTLPAHTSIFTGMVPTYHGVIDNGGYQVPEDVTTLAEVLKEAGYQTSAFISAAVLKKEFNLDQGFDYWNEEDIEPQEELSALVAERPADKVTDDALEWLEKNRQKNFFMWVHYYDPHATYDPPSVYAELYESDYDGEIAFMDSEIKRLLGQMKEYGLYDKTMIIAVGDHGEGLGEHDEQTHATFIYETTQHIPLIMTIPGFQEAGKRIRTLASHMDLMPTVLDFLGLEMPADMNGKSLKEIIELPAGEVIDRYVFLESKHSLLHYGWSPLSAIVGPRYKYIKAPTPEFYDLRNDPDESRNLYREDKKPVTNYKNRLNEFEDKWKEGLKQENPDLSPALEQQLAALGYATSRFKGDPEKAKEKDPKDYVDLMPKLSALNQTQSKDNYRATLRLAKEILERDPENPRALRHRAEALLGVGRFQDSIEATKELMEQEGESAPAYVKIAIAYLRLGVNARQDGDIEGSNGYYRQARETCKKAMEVNERYPITYYYLGRIALALGEHDKALTYFQKDQIAESEYGHVGMALLYEAQQRPALAEAEFEMAKKLAGEHSGVFWQEWGMYLMRQGREDEALEYLEKAVEGDASVEKQGIIQKALEKAREAKGETGEESGSTTGDKDSADE
ncbi:MAG: sulfatase-like hydrolase/transferase [bacterium]